jgi:hypothetical protein
VTNDNEGGEAVGRKANSTHVKPGGGSASTAVVKQTNQEERNDEKRNFDSNDTHAAGQ